MIGLPASVVRSVDYINPHPGSYFLLHCAYPWINPLQVPGSLQAILTDRFQETLKASFGKIQYFVTIQVQKTFLVSALVHILQFSSVLKKVMQTKKTSEHKILPFSFFGAMICAVLFLDAVLPLEGLWLHTAILPQVGPWSLLPTHLLFPGWAITSSITSSKPTPPSVAISWMQLPLLLAAFLLVFLMYLLAVRRLPHYITSFRYILYSTLVLGIISVLFPVVTSPDIYSYITYARIGVLYHLNPLTTLPTAISTDPVYMNVYWNDQPSAYGPTWAAIASVLQWFTLIFGSQSLLPMVLALRLFGLATHLCSTALIWSIAGRLQHLQGRVSPQKRIIATLAFAWNPLLLLEACVNAHNDAAMLLLVLSLYKNRPYPPVLQPTQWIA